VGWGVLGGGGERQNEQMKTPAITTARVHGENGGIVTRGIRKRKKEALQTRTTEGLIF